MKEELPRDVQQHRMYSYNTAPGYVIRDKSSFISKALETRETSVCLALSTGGGDGSGILTASP